MAKIVQGDAYRSWGVRKKSAEQIVYIYLLKQIFLSVVFIIIVVQSLPEKLNDGGGAFHEK
jgi:hypothetical protein